MDCKNCPVCGHQPFWYGSMKSPGEECIECPWAPHCPEDSFDFSTGYLPADKAVAKWNSAVDEFSIAREGK